MIKPRYHKVLMRLKLRGRENDKRIRELKALMRSINLAATSISKLANSERVYTKTGLSDYFRKMLKAEFDLSIPTQNMVIHKVAEAYARQKALGHGFKFPWHHPPIKFKYYDPIKIRQNWLQFFHTATVKIPLIDRLPVVFGRYHPADDRIVMAGFCEIFFKHPKDFWMICDVEVPEGVPFVEEDLGIHKGTVTSMYSSKQFDEGIKARKQEAIDRLIHREPWDDPEDDSLSEEGMETAEEDDKPKPPRDPMIKVVPAPEPESKIKIVSSLDDALPEIKEMERALRPRGRK